MATDVERLIVALEARTRAFENAMNRANGVANRRATAIEKRFMSMNRNITSSFVGLNRGLAAAFLAGVSARGAQRLVDDSIRIQNALKVTGLEGEALKTVYDELFAAAQRQSAPLESLVNLYSRIALSQNELGVSSAEIVTFSETIGMALRVQGSSATEAAGALTQLSQAMGGGVVRAEEFNSIIEGAPAILRAAAAGIAEADGSVAKLRQIMLDGELSSQAFFRGIEAGAHVLEDQLAGAESTVSQAFVRFQNVLQDAAGRLNEGTEASETLVGAINWLTDVVAGADFGPIVSGLGRVADTAAEVVGWIDAVGSALGRLTGLDQVGEYARGRIEQSDINDRLNRAFGDNGAAAKGDRPTVLPAIEVKATPKPISIADYPISGGAGGGGSGGRRRGGGGGRGGRSGADGYQREIEQIRERTEALRAETAAMAGVNPLIDDFDYAITKARASQELLNGAKKAGLTVTPQLQASIDELAEGYARATVEANELAYAQDNARRSAEEMRDLGKDVMGGFISDLRAGKSASEALANALNKVADKLLDVALNSIFDAKPAAGGSGGFLGGLFGSIGKIFGFSRGTANTGGQRGQARGVVHGQEAVIPLPAGGKVPVQIQSPGAAGRGSTETIRVVLQDDSGRMAQIADQRIQTSAGTIVQVSVAQSQRAVRQAMPQMIAETQTRKM